MSIATITQQDLVSAIVDRLRKNQKSLEAQYQDHPTIATFTLDHLLPVEWARQIHQAFPSPSQLTLRSTLRERKYVGVQVNQYDPLISQALYAFQAPEVVSAVQAITKIPELLPDQHLYAGGISMMGEGHFLMPHLDNSHDKDRKMFRVLNLLYYVSPDWKLEYGGNLELWDGGPKGSRRTIHSQFNRLVVMVTHKKSWHSVSPVKHAGVRCCVSNYYFSPQPVDGGDQYHVTTFRAYPGQPLRDTVLLGDNMLRSGIRKVVQRQSTFQIYQPESHDH
jgi:Rps23 Pro-64 3,4-dihydroxylase Tpa1-like proline 4-hydroxylase